MAIFLLSSLIDSLGFQDKARIKTFISWIGSLESFDSKALYALNPEELKSIQEEKQIFLNEIGFDENLLRSFNRIDGDFREKVACQTTEEGVKSVLEEMVNIFYLENPTFKIDVLDTALDKYILEKTNRNTLPLPLPPEKLFPQLFLPLVRCWFPGLPPSPGLLKTCFFFCIQWRALLSWSAGLF